MADRVPFWQASRVGVRKSDPHRINGRFQLATSQHQLLFHTLLPVCKIIPVMKLRSLTLLMISRLQSAGFMAEMVAEMRGAGRFGPFDE